MSIPQTCTVLVIGGGPGGSYAAAALAREGLDVVLLEAAAFPRYHVGESMLASIRHLLRFIGLDATFDRHGFTKKTGAAFKLHPEQQEGFTDFLAAGGPDNYAWNVVRSEADELMFLYARKSGASVYDNTKVTGIEFIPWGNEDDSKDPGHKRPVSAIYTRNPGARPGTIRFEYLVDASGRAGLLSNKYQKTRKFNRGLNNVAHWAYWKGTKMYAPGTARANSPYFEALHDGSGWAWFIPLHNGTTSVGVVMHQDFIISKKKQSSSTEDFYISSLHLTPNLCKLVAVGDGGELVSEIKSASDYSYSASSYASPYLRIVGDAGCFIDPFFSSGVHLALVGALSAATTICAAIKKDCPESVAAKWHSTKVADSYTRFLLVVLSAYKQIRSQNKAILSDLVIQGTADVSTGVSQSELSETVAFCANAWDNVIPEQRASMLQKIQRAFDYYTTTENTENTKNNNNTTTNTNNINLATQRTPDTEAIFEKVKHDLSDEEVKVMNYIRARQLLRTEDTMHLEHFSTDVIDGLAPVVERGRLTLREAVPLLGSGEGVGVGVGENETRQRIG